MERWICWIEAPSMIPHVDALWPCGLTDTLNTADGIFYKLGLTDTLNTADGIFYKPPSSPLQLFISATTTVETRYICP